MIDLAVAVAIVVAMVLHVEATDKTGVHQLLRLQEARRRPSVQS